MHWNKIESVLDVVLEAEPNEWSTLVKEICGDDRELLLEVEELLTRVPKIHNFLETSAGESLFPPGTEDEFSQEKDQDEEFHRIGRYRIIREIAHGGMGRVFLAERADGSYEQKVALKLLHSSLDSETMRRRFRTERQILASLRHPNISRLLDGGVVHAESGQGEHRPYLVMEYLEGQTITKYGEAEDLSVDERLKLFLKVAEAIRQAHHNLVVHCDIKPSNILVTKEKEVKLLDFGIARLLDEGVPVISEPDETDEQPATLTGHGWLTPEYAAPEQIKGERVTMATDVYQLGVVLYELLAGRRPFQKEGNSIRQLEQIILREEPVSPSKATEQSHLRKILQGDLDAIIMKTLQKEPGARYVSTKDLIEDINRYLSEQPVLARGGSIGYRAGKFIRRNRWGVSAAALILVSILTGLGIALWQANVARTERDTAQQEAAKAEAAQDYLVQLFEAADPAENQGEQMTAKEIVQRGIDRLEEDLGHQPEVHIEMLKVLGRVEKALGDFDLSIGLLEQALVKTRELYGDEHLDVAGVAALLGDAVRWNGELERAEILLRDALEIRRRLVVGDNDDTARNMHQLARVLEMQGIFDEAETLYREALVIRERLFGRDSEAVAANLNNLGWLLYQMGKDDEAEEAIKRALEINEQSFEPPHPAIASNMSNLASVLQSKGKYGEAEHYATQAVEQEKKLHGDDHPRVTTAMSNRAVLLINLARYKEAVEQYRRILENDRRQLGPDHVYVGITLAQLSAALIEDGRSGDALPYLDEGLEIFRNTVGEDHRYFAKTLMVRGDALAYQDPVRAAAVLERSVDIFRRVVGSDHPDLAETLTRLGRARLLAGETYAAETALRESIDIQRKNRPSPHTETIWTLTNLGRVLTEQARAEEAEPLLHEAVEASAIALPAGHWRGIAARLELSACLMAGGQETAAREGIEQVLAALQDRTDFHANRLQARALELSKL